MNAVKGSPFFGRVNNFTVVKIDQLVHFFLYTVAAQAAMGIILHEAFPD
ncbi:hypothetical protein J7E71_25155 [Mesobacillus foraminis]|nr:hypothetical protein [Mesobacillus foraminis]MBT2759163.1 hypothetical protein [Mesobacillus foraminis]